MMKERLPTFKANHSLALLCLAFGLYSAEAVADMAESSLQNATDSSATHLFLLNPAIVKPAGTKAGAFALRSTKKTTLKQEAEGGDNIESNTNDDYLVFAAGADLGAGAGLGLSHQALYRKVDTNLASRNSQPNFVETHKIQHTAARLFIELTEQIRAGVAIRYLFRDSSILGDPFIGQAALTRYKTTLFGYGSGFAANYGNATFAYTYFPPLRGKSEIYGEEFIVVEPGEIAANAAYKLNAPWTVGILAKRWINEIDDRAEGTTDATNQTNISLMGLDPDQYLIPKQLLMIGGDFEFNKALTFKVSLGQEQAGFNFRDYVRYNRIDVRQRGNQDENIKYNRVRAVVRFINNNLEFNAGLGLFQRKFNFPESMNSGVYESGGKELSVSVGMKI
jgi:hypothetical protein